MDDCIAYVSCAEDRQIAILAMDRATGALRDVAVVTVPGADGPSSSMALALSPDHTALYAATRAAPVALSSFAIDADGMLSLLGVAPAVDQLAYIATDRTGRHLLGASYGGAKLTANPIDASGMARSPASWIMQTPPRAHSIITDPTNRFALAASLGGDCILRLAFDANDGSFRPLTEVTTKTGAGPRHLRFSPSGQFLYLINELNGTINAYAFDSETGELTELQSVSLLPDGASGEIAAADIHITPDGRFLYGSERRSNTLTGFAVDAETGMLSKIGTVPTKSAARGFAIDPSGQFLLCAEQDTRSMAMFRIDQDHGTLSQIGAHAVGGSPNWVEFLT